MKMPGNLRDDIQRFARTGKGAVVCLALAAAALRAGDGPAVGATNNAATNVLWLWIDAPTNVARSDLFARTDLTTTNRWQPPGMCNIISTSSAWRTTATLEMGFFHVGRVGGPDCPGSGRRSEDGWMQELSVGMERDLDHGDSAISVGVGVSVGRATTRFP